MNFIHQSMLSIISIAIVLFFFAACTHTHPEGEEHDHDHGEAAHDDHDGHDDHDDHEEGIHLSKEQIKTMDITFGEFSQVKINDFINATGTLGLPPNAYSSVSAKANGFIKDSNKYIEGSYVKKGVVMAYLENPEFIQQQQEYLELSAELSYLRQELSRQQQLVAANAGVEKNVQQLQSEVSRKIASTKGIAKQLGYLGIDVAGLTTDNIRERIAIISPMSGYITTIKMHNGMYVTPSIELMEIVNETHLHLELDVFEKDIAQVKKDQKISYTVPALGNTMYEGEVHIIGKEFNTENKTVRIHGHLEKVRPTFIKDLFVEAKIWMNDQTVQALPESAIIKDGASSYIYVGDEQQVGKSVTFEQIMVLPGLTEKAFTAVKLLDTIPEGMKIVTSGAYYVYAQSKVGELEHSH